MVHLGDADRLELDRRARLHETAPRTRDRLEMVRLSDAGWSIPKIAHHLQRHEYVVRRWIKAFLAGGFDALFDLPHVGRRSCVTPALVDALRTKIRETNRTWTSAQLTQWLADHFGVKVCPDHLSYLLRRAKLSYKRTTRSLKHKQDPEKVAQSKAELDELKRGLPPA